eukprot:gene6874-4949_t
MASFEVSDIQRDISAIYSSSTGHNIFSLYATGGGVALPSWLLTVPGASGSVMNIQMPYSRHATLELLDQHNVLDKQHADENLSFCSNDMAFGAPKRGAHRCHIAVVSAREVTSYTLTLDKNLGRSRMAEDTICSQLLLHAIREQSILSNDNGDSNIPNTLHRYRGNEFSFLGEADHLAIHRHIERNLLEDVCAKRSRHALYFPSVAATLPSPASSTSKGPVVHDWIHAADVKVPPGSIVFPGSFNPVHEGHISLALAALERHRELMKRVDPASLSAYPLVIFEIAAVNADKPPTAMDVLEARLQQFDPATNPLMQRLIERSVPYAVAITSEPLFVNKAAIFPHTTFLIGADTLERLFNLKYYLPAGSSAAGSASGNDIALTHLVKAMGQLADKHCHFIVGGRTRQTKPAATAAGGVPPVAATVAFPIADEDVFQTMETIFEDDVGAQCVFGLWPNMFVGISEEQFRCDLSSTEIRKQLQLQGVVRRVARVNVAR